MTAFAEILIAKFPPVLTQTELADVLRLHVQTVRRLDRAGKFPFPNVSPTSEKRYRLTDVIAYLEQPSASKSKIGRPVGSKNKIKTHAPTA